MKISFLLLVAFIAFSCSPESKAKSIIEKRLKTSMNDWGSYEFVEMTPLKGYYTTFFNEEGASIFRKTLDYKDQLGRLQIEAKYPELYSKKRYKEIVDSIPIYEKMIKSLDEEYTNKEKNFKGKLRGYNTQFKFRGKNKLGVLVLNCYKVYFNKDITEIVHIEDCSN